MRTYDVFRIDFDDSNRAAYRVPEVWNEPRLSFFFERNERAKEVRINYDGVRSLHSLVINYQEELFKRDICAVRYLPEGIGVLRASRYFSECGFTALRDSVFRGIMPAVEDIDAAFHRFGTFVRPGKFAAALGLTGSDVEDFVKSYRSQFEPVSEIEAAAYDFKVWTGRPMLRIFRKKCLPEAVNSSPLFGACMVGRPRNVSWYGEQKGKVGAAALVSKSDGRIYARAVLWLNGSFQDTESGAVQWSGSIADRQYFYDERRLLILRYFLERAGYAFKVDNSHDTGGDFMLPGGAKLSGSSYRISAAINTTEAPGFPFLDTLCNISSDGVACNLSDGLTGDVFRLRAVQGDREHLGRFTRVTLGDFIGQVKIARRCQSLLLPDGSRAVHYGGGDAFSNFGAVVPMYAAPAGSTDGEVVPAGLTTAVQVLVRAGWSSGPDTAVTVRAYPHQLRFNPDAGRWEVVTLWDSVRAAWLPVDRFRVWRSGEVSAV